MKMAKASEADINMAMELCSALDVLGQRWVPCMPEAIEQLQDDDESEPFDRDDDSQCGRAMRHLLALADRASLSRVVFGCAVMLDPVNRCVDPNADVIEHHPDSKAGHQAKRLRLLEEWEEEHSCVLWWCLPIEEAPYVGHPNCDTWPGYHTHWTPLIVPEPTNEGNTPK
jgi:hypothetical protein